jgi:hypothetical protein
MPRFGVSSKDGISGGLKVFITQGATTVVGYIGEGAAKTLSSQWTSPFESDTLGNAGGASRIAGLAQSGQSGEDSGKLTTVTQHNSVMVWEGTTPPTINMPVYFQAYADAKAEVHDAIKALETMASPELKEYLPGGRTPQLVVIDVGRRFKITNAVITEVTSELDAPRTKDGYMTRNTVMLSITPDRMINASEINSMYP